MFRDDRAWQGEISNVREGESAEGCGMARRMRVTYTGTRKHRGDSPYGSSSKFLGRRRIPRDRQHTSLQLRCVREAKEQMVRCPISLSPSC